MPADTLPNVAEVFNDDTPPAEPDAPVDSPSADEPAVDTPSADDTPDDSADDDADAKALEDVFNDDKPKDDKPADDKAPTIDDKPKDDAPPEDMSKYPKDFRKRLEQVNTELATLKQQEKTLRDELAAAKEAKGGDSEAIAKSLEAREQELKELRGELRKVRFEKSEDYLEKYEKPFKTAASIAQEEVEKLKILDTDPQTGESVKRPATWEDFVEIYKMEPDEQDEAIDAKFGKSAYRVSHHLALLKSRDRDMNDALEKEKSDWESAQANETAAMARQYQELNKVWEQTNKDLQSKRPDWYGEINGDDEGNELLRKGYETFEPYWKSRSQMKREDIIVYETQLRNRAAAMPRMAHLNTKLRTQVTQLEAKIQKLLGKGPGKELRGDVGDAQSDSDNLDGLLNQSFQRGED
jgi:hypothetical protein